ncbi:MAG: hypothetical protein ACYDGR_00225 [Candidatus Dormibacteria bacterium]
MVAQTHAEGNLHGPDTVVLVRGDGTTAATTRFDGVRDTEAPFCCPLVLTTGQVEVGHDAVYFLERSGRIRALRRSGEVVVLGALPPSTESRATSFAVSPDGGTIIAVEISTPPVVRPSDRPSYIGDGTWTQDVLHITPGGSEPLRRTGKTEYLAMVAWSTSGALALVGSASFVQNDPGPPGHTWFGGHLEVMGTDGIPGPPLGGAACHPWSVNDEGTVVCLDDEYSADHVTVRGAGGNLLWDVGKQAGFMALSPDAGRMAVPGRVMSKDGSAVVLPAGFNPVGWLDDQSVVGVRFSDPYPVSPPSGKLYLLRLDHPATQLDLHVDGRFVGVLR